MTEEQKLNKIKKWCKYGFNADKPNWAKRKYTPMIIPPSVYNTLVEMGIEDMSGVIADPYMPESE